MHDSSPIYHGIDQEFGELLRLLDEPETTGAILIALTAWMTVAVVAMIASAVASASLY